MKRLAALLLVVACEKSGPVEATPGSSTTAVAETPKVIVVDAGVATLPNDAAKVASVDASSAPTGPTQEDLEAMANGLAVVGESRVGDMNRRRPGADLNAQINAVRDSGKSVAVGGRTNVGTRGAPTTVDKVPTGRISVSKKVAFDDTSLTADAVLAKTMSAYMTGIKRCYTTYLKKDPSARGKLKLTFSVNETGRAVSPKPTGFASEIDACLTGMMTSWRYPVPKDKDGEATEAAFEIDLQLVPD